ncbi:MAG TPA: ABC transporter permease [Pyrinomonadaceae bacterium]|nr:ABC transporter permease [Pyrinomonadaceae bacterium]
MDNLIKDIRYGIRSLLKRPGFTVVAVGTLALGIGANTAIFSVVNAVLLRPLPFKDAKQLVMVWNKGVEAAGGDRTPLAFADLLDWRAQSRSFESIGAFQNAQYNYAGGDIPEQVRGTAVTANFLSLLGLPVQLGRDFTAEDERAGAPRVVLLSDHFWRTRFNADPSVVGRPITLSGISGVIIGVLPAKFAFPSKEVELLSAMQLAQPTRRGPYFLNGVARLKQGVTIEQARAETRTMKSSFDKHNFNFNLLSVNDFIVGDVRLALIALWVSVTLVLLIATVNVANLTLVRAESRVKEISIRTALGASRKRIIAQSMTESLMLAIAGGALALLLASLGIDLVLKLAPAGLPRLEQIGIDARVLGWTALVSMLSGLIFGLAPAWQSSRLDLNESLKEGGRSSMQGRQRWRKLLVVTELALAVMLVTGAGLLVKSLWRLQHVDVGVNPERVLTMQLVLRGQRYNESQQVREFYSRLVEQTQNLPGVRGVAVSNSLPPNTTDFSSNFAIEGHSSAEDQGQRVAYFIRVSPDYFRTLGIPLRSGRLFNGSDTSDAPNVMLINETFERRFFSGENPIGKRINIGNEREPDWNQVVGVVDDVKYNGVAEGVQPALYQPVAQAPSWEMSLIIKTDVADPLGLTPAVRNEVKRLDPELPVAEVSTLDDCIYSAMAQPRFRTMLIALFAAVALILACVGVYGVISYSVSQRTHEIGIRMALGAQTTDVLHMVIKQGLGLTATGVAIGLAASFALTRLMSSLLFEVKATDLSTFAITALLLAVTALVASYLPARRATRVDPLVALRYE